MNSYEKLVRDTVRFLQEGRDYPLGGVPPLPDVSVSSDAPKALIFSPHPDDEVIIGGLPLRMLREKHLNVLNVAVTQGSNPARQQERWKELQDCCQHIGFGLIQTRSNGLEGINLKGKKEDPERWAKSVDCIASILREQQPAYIFLPHDDDWNSTHIGTHHLVIEALKKQKEDFTCTVIETEFWGAMDSPNLMVESSEKDVTDLITALTFHVGEVRRNPYHLRMTAWMIDNVRRGCELVGGQGGESPDYAFATLYRLRKWKDQQLHQVWDGGRFVSQDESLDLLD